MIPAEVEFIKVDILTDLICVSGGNNDVDINDVGERLRGSDILVPTKWNYRGMVTDYDIDSEDEWY